MEDKQKNLDSFFEQVYAVVRLIPKGRITSYGAIAKYLGTARSSRMVGWAMNGAHTVQPESSCSSCGEQKWTANRKASFWRT